MESTSASPAPTQSSAPANTALHPTDTLNQESLQDAAELFAVAICALAYANGDLKERLEAARTALRGHGLGPDLPRELRAPFAAVITLDLDALTAEQLGRVAEQVVSMGFAVYKAA